MDKHVREETSPPPPAHSVILLVRVAVHQPADIWNKVIWKSATWLGFLDPLCEA